MSLLYRFIFYSEEIFIIIINAFTVTFDQFNESLLSKSIHL